jgi:hypothetical protein
MKHIKQYKTKRPLFIYDTRDGFKLELQENKHIRISFETFKHLTQ